MKETEEHYNFTDRQKWQHGLNGTPKKNWVKSRNLGAGKKSFYIPIEVQQALADVFFNEFDVVKCEPMVIANEIVCTVTISLLPSYPNSEHRTITGSASKPIQCDSGSSPAKFPLGKKTNALDILSSSAYILLSLSVISFNLDGFCVAAFSSSSSVASISS